MYKKPPYKIKATVIKPKTPRAILINRAAISRISPLPKPIVLFIGLIPNVSVWANAACAPKNTNPAMMRPVKSSVVRLNINTIDLIAGPMDLPL